MTRKQCKACPWKVTTDPHQIPDGYSVEKHENLAGTIADPGSINIRQPLRMMACHESKNDRPITCVGWLVHQLGEGNNIALRLGVVTGRVDADVETVGPQHERFEDTLPACSVKKKRKA